MALLRRPLSDILFHIASICVAFTTTMFASYMIVYGTSERTESKFEASQTAIKDPIDRDNVPTRQWAEIADRADPLTTASLRDSADNLPRKQIRTAKIEDYSLANRYVLRAVFQGTALIEIRNELSSELWPAMEGSLVPGAGKVIAIEKRDDHWQVITTERTIAEEKR